MDEGTAGDPAVDEARAGAHPASDGSLGALASQMAHEEGETPGYERLLTSAEERLDDVEAALARLDDGTYHACSRCGAPVDTTAVPDPLDPRCDVHAA
jgi:RNA polymerase-binding transcription factor DksA